MKRLVELGDIQYLKKGIGTTSGGYEDFSGTSRVLHFLKERGKAIPYTDSYQSTYGDENYYKCWLVYFLLKNGKKICAVNTYRWRDAHTGESGSVKGKKIMDFLSSENIKPNDIKLIRLIVRRG